METTDHSTDPRKVYSLRQTDCKNLTHNQKLHRADCIGEVRVPFIIQPRPRPRPQPTPKPPAEFRLPRQLFLNLPHTEDFSGEIFSLGAGTALDLASYAIGRAAAPRAVRPVGARRPPARLRGLRGRALIAPAEEFDPAAREFGGDIEQGIADRRRLLRQRAGYRFTEAPTEQADWERALAGARDQARRVATGFNRAGMRGMINAMRGYNAMRPVGAHPPEPRDIEMTEPAAQEVPRAPVDIPEELQGLQEQLEAQAAEITISETGEMVDVPLGDTSATTTEAAGAVDEVPSATRSILGRAGRATSEAAGRALAPVSQAAGRAVSATNVALRPLLQATGRTVGTLGAEALGSSIASATATTVASDILGVAGLGLGVYSEVSSIIKGKKLISDTNNYINGYGGVSMSERLQGKNLAKVFSSMQDKVSKLSVQLETLKKQPSSPEVQREIHDTQSNINNLNNYFNKLSQAATDGRPIITYRDASGQDGIVIQLDKAQLATAIKNYQTNPDVFKGVPRQQLEFMGLNPNMTLGKAGAVKTPDGSYVPKESLTLKENAKLSAGEMSGVNFNAKPTTNVKTWTPGAGGGNWTYFYLSQSVRETQGQNGPFSSLQDIQNSYVPANTIQGQANIDYATKAYAEIQKIKDPKVRAYLQYKLDDFAYTNKLPGATKPGPAPAVPTQAELDAIPETATTAAHGRQLISQQSALSTLVGAKPTALPQITSQDKVQYANQINTYNANVLKAGTQYEQDLHDYNKQVAEQTQTPIVGGFSGITAAQAKQVGQFVQNNLKTMPAPAPAPAPAPSS
jgi:hypothetical protein